MHCPMAKEPIRKVKLKGGRVRHRLVVDIGKDPETGKRLQFTHTYDSLNEARSELSKIRHERNTGTYVQPSKWTLNQELDAFMAGRRRSAATIRNNQDALRPARERLGERELQSLAKADFDALVTWMQSAGRKRGGEAGTGLGPRSVAITLGALQQALEIAVAERRIPFNPVRLVERPAQVKPVHDQWSDTEETAFFAVAERDRLAAVIELFARGLRPEELCGIRWSDIDLRAKTAAVGRNVRTMVAGQVVEKEAKTRAGERTLPLDDALAVDLKAWKARRAAEKLAAGEMYEDGDYVLCDELGRPWKTDKLRRYMRTIMEQAGVRRVTPYEAMRHAAGSRMARAGVSPNVIAAWLGHTRASFTLDTYVHARPEDLAAGRDALSRTPDRAGTA